MSSRPARGFQPPGPGRAPWREQPGPRDRFIALVTHRGFSSPSHRRPHPRIPSLPRPVPDTRRRGTPRSPRAPRPAAPAPRAQTLSHAGQTRTRSCSHRLRRLPQPPPRARRRLALPYWGKGEKTAAPVPTPRSRPKCGLRAAPLQLQPPRGGGSRPRPGARQLLLGYGGCGRAARKREDHPGTDSNALQAREHVTSAARSSREGGRGAQRAPHKARARARRHRHPRESRNQTREQRRRQARDGAGRKGRWEEAGRIQQAARGWAGLRSHDRPRPLRPFGVGGKWGSGLASGALRSSVTVLLLEMAGSWSICLGTVFSRVGGSLVPSRLFGTPRSPARSATASSAAG